MRPCPCCSSTSTPDLLLSYQTTHAGEQSVYACPCGMVFCGGTSHTDYSHSIYEMPSAIGSGVRPHDHARLKEVALMCSSFSLTSHSLLDVGSGQGGLLDAFSALGYRNLTGLDPSLICATALSKRGHKAIHGHLSDVGEKFDFITLTHVLEHIDDIPLFLRELRIHLNPLGRAYIEVPNSSRHADYSIPFLELNSEHINHFSIATLRTTLERNGFDILAIDQKEIHLTNGAEYPALWALVERKFSVSSVQRYIDGSRADMKSVNHRLEISLGNAKELILWGAGEYLAHILPLPAISNRTIRQIIDRNPSLHGRWIQGHRVQPSSETLPTLPIVIAAIVAEHDIRADILNLNLSNPVIGLGL